MTPKVVTANIDMGWLVICVGELCDFFNQKPSAVNNP